MAEILTGLVVSAITEVGKWIVVPMIRQFNYLCCFTANIETLNQEAEKLVDTIAELQVKVKVAMNNAQDIRPPVLTWLTDADRIQEEKGGIDSDLQIVQKGCLAVPSRFSLSKKAKKTAEAMKELCNRCNGFGNNISMPRADIPANQLFSSERPMEFQSRKEIEEEIMNSLRCEKINKLGIGGMGGIGKTTMAERLMDRVREEKLFDERVIAVVSQPVDLLRIQNQIAEQLGFMELKNYDTLRARATQLSIRLSGTKRILIVLDDVWERLNLEYLGIPCTKDSKGCTVLFTSRDAEVLQEMDVKVFAMQILSDGEALKLFKEKAGDRVNDPKITETAEMVAEECKGLPMALVIIAAALKDKDEPAWKDALRRLRIANASQEFQVKVYDRLKLSYDFLADEEKSLFLLCSLFPEDFSIHYEDLMLYSMRLNELKIVDTLQEARDRVCTIVDTLKNRFLLLDGDNEREVKMHDLIRDLAISLAKKEGSLGDWLRLEEERAENCKWISHFTTSTNESFDRLRGYSFSRLCLLIIQCQIPVWSGKKLEIDNLFFLEGMQRLNILSFKCISIQSLERVIQFVKNLKILRLDFSNFETLSPIGGLSKLEVLSCRGCVGIKKASEEIGGLTSLKLLDLTSCRYLKEIAPGVISKLVELEELKMWNSFSEWESSRVCEENRRNASLTELASLEKLSWLEIEISDDSLVEEEIHLSPKLLYYKIDICGIYITTEYFSVPKKSMGLRRFPRDRKIGNWIQNLLHRVEDQLVLDGNGWRNLDLSQAYRMVKILYITECAEVLEKLVDAPADGDVFRKLEDLTLTRFPHLYGSIVEGKAGKDVMIFPKLKRMELSELSFVTSFSKGIESIEFPLLEYLSIMNCPELKQFISPMKAPKNNTNKSSDLLSNEKRGTVEGIHELDDDNMHGTAESLHLFCNNKVKFGELMKDLTITEYRHVKNIWCQNTQPCFLRTLKKLIIWNCGDITTLFSSFSMVQHLVNLQTLSIEKCKHMERVVITNDKDDEICIENIEEASSSSTTSDKRKTKHIGKSRHVAFPKLETLLLHTLPSLTNFGKGIDSVEFPVLHDLSIESCPQLSEMVSPAIENNTKREDKKQHVNYSSLFGKSQTTVVDTIIWESEQINREDDDVHDLIGSPHLFCNNKVKFGELMKDLKITHHVSNIWCQNIQPYFLRTLKKLDIWYCGNLTTLFSSFLMVQHLVNLQALYILICEHMEQVVISNDKDEICVENIEEASSSSTTNDGRKTKHIGKARHVAFPNLETLELCELPSLTNFGKGIDSLEFPVLHNLSIRSCPQLSEMVSQAMESNTKSENKKKHVSYSPLFRKVKFGDLRELTINYCDGIRSLLSNSMVDNLVRLRCLRIEGCKGMEKVIADENEKSVHSLPLQSLEELYLFELPCLRMFCGWKFSLQLPKLKRIGILECPQMEFLTVGSLTTPKLNELSVDYRVLEIEDVINKNHDLNGLLRQHIMPTTGTEVQSEEKHKTGRGEFVDVVV